MRINTHEAKVIKGSTIHTTLRRRELISDPLLNKGSAFSQNERQSLELFGLIPCTEESLETQLQRAYEALKQKNTPIEKHVYLRALQDTNEVLYYALIKAHIAETLPLIYTPVVGEACQHFHMIYRRPRGLFISYPERDRMEEIFANIETQNIQVIVVSDGERILGLGDQGVGGMGIPIGKVSLYTACGGIHPAYGLPIILDTGTDNEERLNDPLYFGWRNKRIRGKEYDDFVEHFVQAVTKKFPKALLQWEDFAIDHANLLLDRYRHRLCTFNDDIQGTASVTLAGLLAAVKVCKSSLREQKIAILGAGSAGTGIADHLVLAMGKEGLSREEAISRIWLIDREGLLTDEMKNLKSFQQTYAQPRQKLSSWNVSNPQQITLKDVVVNAHPTILIGASTSFGAFNEDLIREMAKHVKQPIIFPLSNPSSRCEADPKDIVMWTEGRAVVGTGTKYPDVPYHGKSYRIGQINNCYIFPAMGLAIVATQAARVSETMFLAAAYALSELAPALKDPTDSLFPPADQIPEAAKIIAYAIAVQAQKEGLAAMLSPDELHDRIEETFWNPQYPAIVPLE